MNKIQKAKAAFAAFIVSAPVVALADVTEHMKSAATEMGKLETGIAAIGAVMIGLVVTMKGYSVAKRMVNRA